MFISEYTLNTILSSFIELQQIEKSEYLSTEVIETVIHDFKEIFGDHEKVRIDIIPTPMTSLHPRYRPRVYLTKDWSELTFMADIHIKNPFDEEVDAMLI